MKSLDQYIRENKQLFEEEPEAGHFERLQQKMDRGHRKIVLLRWTSAVAASIVLLFSAGVLWQYTQKSDFTTIACENTDDMKHCYLNKMNDMAGQIKELTKDLDQWDQEQVMDDVKSIIDATKDDSFEEEIPKELPEETTQSILSDYYQRNLESLHTIAKTLEE